VKLLLPLATALENASCGVGGISERGKEKRRRLLNYLRDHPEELRPASP